MGDRIVRVGVAVLIERGRHVLMGQRIGSHGSGTWSFPGGHIDFGDEPEEAVRREVMEETGLTIGKITRYRPMPWVNTHFEEEGKQYITLYFQGEFTGGTPKTMEPDKCVGWEWVEWDKPPTPLFQPIATHWGKLARG